MIDAYVVTKINIEIHFLALLALSRKIVIWKLNCDEKRNPPFCINSFDISLWLLLDYLTDKYRQTNIFGVKIPILSAVNQGHCILRRQAKKQSNAIDFFSFWGFRLFLILVYLFTFLMLYWYPFCFVINHGSVHSRLVYANILLPLGTYLRLWKSFILRSKLLLGHLINSFRNIIYVISINFCIILKCQMILSNNHMNKETFNFPETYLISFVSKK